jgi:hypothetical protein
MKPTLTDVHIDTPLSNVSIKYQNALYVAEKLFPPVTVNKESDKYFKYGKEDFRIYKALRADGAEAQEVDWSVSTDSYSCDEYALSKLVTDRVRDNADNPLKPDIDTTEYLTNMILLQLENKVMSIATDTNNYDSGHYETLSGTDQWDDYENSDPRKTISDVKSVIAKKIGQDPNTMIVGKEVHEKLKYHPKILDAIKYTNLGVATVDLLKQLFEVDNYYVAGALYETAKEGQTSSLNYLWGKNVIVAYVAPNVGLKVLTFGVTFRKTGYRRVKKWREEKRNGDMIEVADLFVPKVVCSDAAYLLKSVIA